MRLIYLCLLMPLIAQAASLTLGEDVRLLQVDNAAVRQGIFAKSASAIELDEGPHTLLVRYDRLFELGRNAHEQVRGGNVEISFEVESGRAYHLATKDAPTSLVGAKAFAKAPVFVITKDNAPLHTLEVETAPSSGILGQLLGVDTAPSTGDKVARFKILWESASTQERARIQEWINR